LRKLHGAHFDAVLVHDAEDLIHPDSLSLINLKLNEYDTVQVPVLPLATRLGELTHGIYCDEFAEFQTIDMPARGLSGSFLPSNGVGTGYSRAVLERLAEERGNRVFEPDSLTEDYESGVRIRLGFRQFFAPLERHNAYRMACAGRVYGWKLATGVPVRAFYESIINGITTLRAIRIYVAARVEGRPLAWLKTEHSYPNRAALESSWKGLEEVLVGSGYIAAETLSMAQRLKGPDADLGHFLLANGLLSEEQHYCEAASLCSGLASATELHQSGARSAAGTMFTPESVIDM
jgi:hypothetical protein